MRATKQTPVARYEFTFLYKNLQIAHLQIAQLYCIIFFFVNNGVKVLLLFSKYLLNTYNLPVV